MALPVGASINPIGGYSLPVSKTVYTTSAPALQETSAVAVPRASDVIDAEDLLRHRQTHATWQHALPDQRARRALAAYGALEQIRQRDFVSQVLGIDEYV